MKEAARGRETGDRGVCVRRNIDSAMRWSKRRKTGGATQDGI